MAKTEGTYLIAHGASVVVVRDGKRKPVNAGQGEHFTDEEIKSIRAASPGALRVPINEGTGKAIVEDDVEDDDADDIDDTGKTAAPTGGKKGKKKAAPESKPADADADDDDI